MDCERIEMEVKRQTKEIRMSYYGTSVLFAVIFALTGDMDATLWRVIGSTWFLITFAGVEGYFIPKIQLYCKLIGELTDELRTLKSTLRAQ